MSFTVANRPRTTREYKGKHWSYENKLYRFLEKHGRDRHQGWMDHMDTFKEVGEERVFVAHPYRVTDADMTELTYLSDNGWDVTIYANSAYHEYTVEIHVSPSA